ncbi:unnamed protein product [Cylindrotheca closterium]|uniref:Uncharacterized protein n=1 Tax=Cylindrotheca closterium TaxID=2856 RepID=A0AAD2GDE7_9STRA|nr:unnamed protein product [Cylindrotheca closterium]
MAPTSKDEESPKEVQFHKSVSTSTSYGSIDVNKSNGGEDEDIIMEEDSSLLRHSIHLGMTGFASENIWTRLRRTASFQQHGDEYKLVPTKVVDNVKLVTDPTLQSNEKGKLYFAERSFYNNMEAPQYALTVNDDIYRRIFAEVNDSRSSPFGLYFCCHGGDGAHTGVSHEDYVDIQLAWVLIGVVFLAIFVLSFV